MRENPSPTVGPNGSPRHNDNARIREGITRSRRTFQPQKTSRPKSSVPEAAINAPLTEHKDVLERNILAAVLSAIPHQSRFVIVFPGFQMGFKRDGFEQAVTKNWLQLPKGMYHYRGTTSAMTAFGAVKGLVTMLGKIFDIDEIQDRLVFATDEQTEILLREGTYTHYVMLGTRSHEYSRQVLHQYSKDFEFSFDEDSWSVIDKRENKRYTVPDPSKSIPGEPVEGMDYALIEKIVDEVTHRIIFVIGGMWDTGTLAAGNFLIEHREEIFKRFGSSGFQYLLEVPAGSIHVKHIVIERSPHPT